MSKKPKPWWRKDRGIWCVQLNGKRHNLGPDKKAADRRYHRLMAEPQKQSLPSSSVVAVIDEFLDWCHKHVAAATYEWYRARLQEFVKTLPDDLSVGQFKPFHVTKWIDNHKEWSDGSKRNACRSVQRAMKWAVEQGLISRSPIAHLKKPRGGKRDFVVAPPDFERILSSVPDPAFRDLLIISWETGCRPQESLRVEARHVELENSRWVFPQTEGKTNVPRAVYLPEEALQITKRLMLQFPEGPLFRNSRGRPWTTSAVNCAFCRIQIKMGRAIMKQKSQTIEDRNVRGFAKRLNPVRTVHGDIVEKTAKELLKEARRKLTKRLAAKLAPKYCLYTLRQSWATHALQRGVDSLTVAILMAYYPKTHPA